MRISAAGNKARYPVRSSARGFTLLELLVVVGIIAIASAGVAFAMRDSAQTRIEREAQRLAALLESARAQSRARGVAVVWRSQGAGFTFEGLPKDTLPGNWLDAGTTVPEGSRLELGPEPIIGAQSVTIASMQADGPAWRVATDGLRPFSAQIGSASP